MTEKDLLLDCLLFEPECLAETAWSGHLPYAHYLMRTLKPKVVVELGTHRGPSYFAMCQTVKQFKLNTKTYAVDTWQGEEHAGFYDESVYHSVQKENEKYKAFSTLLRCTFDDALKQFEDGSVDLLHIDGFHSYEAVKHDFDTWLPKLAKGATVIFHDTNERREGFGVYRFWDELMKQYSGFEFKHSHGLGVLQLPGAKTNLVPKAADLAEHLRVFEAAGLLSDSKMIEKQHGYLPTAIAVTKLIRRVSNMESSTSWKVTSPLRAFTGLLKRK